MSWNCKDLYECSQMVAFISEELPEGYNNAVLANGVLKLFREKVLWHNSKIEYVYNALLGWYYNRVNNNMVETELMRYIKNESDDNIFILLKNYWVYYLLSVYFPPYKSIIQKERYDRYNYLH